MRRQRAIQLEARLIQWLLDFPQSDALDWPMWDWYGAFVQGCNGRSLPLSLLCRSMPTCAECPFWRCPQCDYRDHYGSCNAPDGCEGYECVLDLIEDARGRSRVSALEEARTRLRTKTTQQ